ncbi:aminoacyl-tRNA hydrolase [Candidatus Parcubacteria bacterium]|nr:aminoacyl-tRNA hydrolase [Candidatus Parcubacteria bacterium]
MKLIVGLGNVGRDYERTRHNIGFRVADALSAAWGLTWRERADCEATVAEGSRDGAKIVLAKPATMMNDSGRAVAKLGHYYRLTPGEILVAHDDVDLSFGEIRIEAGRGSAGHRGVESLIEALGTKEFHRVRIGVRNGQYRPGTKTADEFVLADFTNEEEKQLPAIIQKAIAAIEASFDGGQPDNAQ